MSVSEPSVREPLDDDFAQTLRLTLVSGVGPRLRKALLDRFGDSAAVFQASQSELRQTPGIGAKLCAAIDAAREIDVAAEMSLCAKNGIDLISLEHPSYPRSLKEIPDPPGILYTRGTIKPTDMLAVAIVGSRHATHYGLTQAERLAASLARAGYTIISGLARGIDAAAHRGALSAGGRTLAVLGSGLLNIYPPEHVGLADEVAACGAVVSECACRAKPLAGAFPQRNRIIAGMSLGIIVVEAAKSSGALITARHAMEQNRDVFAVPGRVDNRMSQGCHQLIRDGATLVETVDDVLEQLGPLVEGTTTDDGRSVHHPAELQLNDTERQVLDAVELEPTSTDRVIATAGLPTPQVLATLSVLEVRRLIRRVGGSQFVRIG